jgi:hypothetical protein
MQQRLGVQVALRIKVRLQRIRAALQSPPRTKQGIAGDGVRQQPVHDAGLRPVLCVRGPFPGVITARGAFVEKVGPERIVAAERSVAERLRIVGIGAAFDQQVCQLGRFRMGWLGVNGGQRRSYS